jgi:hypothetical protein
MDPYEVQIRTTADPSGAEEIERKLRDVKSEADQINAAPTRAAAAPETAISEAAVEARMTAEERTSSLIAQRQILIDLELEKTQALASGEVERAAAIESQIAIRQISLQIQTGAALSERESVAIARQLLEAEAQITFQKGLQAAASNEANAGNLLAGVNLGKARQEATVLGRELLTGGNTTRTLGSLLGSLGPAILPVIAEVGALYALMAGTNTAAQTLGKILGGFSFGDLISGLNPEAIAREITAANQLKQKLQEIDKLSFEQLSSNLDKGREKLTELTDKYREELLKDDSLLEPIRQKHAEVLQSMRNQVAALTRENELLEFERNIKEATAKLEEQRTAEIEKQAALRKADIAAQSEVTKLEKDISSTRESGFSNTQKVDLYKQKVAEINHELQNLGISASSPEDAIKKSIGLSDTQRAKILEQVKAWQDVNGEQTKINKAIDDEKKKIDDENKTALAEKIRLLREAAKYNPAGGYDAQADKLAGTGPGSGKVDENYYKNVLAQSSPDSQDATNAKLALASLYAKAADAVKLAGDTGDAASKAITDTAKGGTDALSKAVTDVSARITPLFQPVADRISTDIPKAISDGVAQINAAVTAGIGNIANDFKSQVANLQQQINVIWQNL